MTTTMNDENNKIFMPPNTAMAAPLIIDANPHDPNLVFGTNGFTIRKPFPYKNTQGDIFCIVCCLQKGELVFQPKANFKIFRERGAVIGENSDRSALVEKLFGFKNVCGGRLCDSHYRYIMKFKNKSASNNDSPTSNSIDGEAPTTKRKKRKTDLKTIPSSTDIESNGNTLGIASVTRKKKKEQQQQHYSELNHDSSVDIATNNMNMNMNNNNMIPSNNNGCISNETNEKEMDEQSINSSSYQVIVNEPNSQPMLNNNMHHHTTYSSTSTTINNNNIQMNYRSREEIAREERYATKRRFNFLVRLVEEMVDEEEIHYHYQLYLKQQEELKRNPSLRNSTHSATTTIQSLEYLEEDDEEDESSTLSSSSNNQEEDQIITNEYR